MIARAIRVSRQPCYIWDAQGGFANTREVLTAGANSGEAIKHYLLQPSFLTTFTRKLQWQSNATTRG